MPNLSRLLHDTVAVEVARLRASLFSAAFSLLLLGIAALISLIGVVFLLLGAYQSLAEALPAWQAGGLTAIALLLIAALLVLVNRRRISVSRLPPPVEPPLSSVARELRQTAERGITAGEMLAGKAIKPFDLALVAFIAGLIVSKSVYPRRPIQQRRSELGG